MTFVADVCISIGSSLVLYMGSLFGSACSSIVRTFRRGFKFFSTRYILNVRQWIGKIFTRE